ncbi:MAG: mannosyltransferase, partial [Actinomycetota bacterium]|nr:mannosyltransferase [Actinomycetota bacterium]
MSLPARSRPGRLPEFTAAAVTIAITSTGVTTVSPWRDELATRLAAGRDLTDLWALVRTVDLVHLPYYLLAHTVLSVNDSITALRAVSVLAMAVTASVLVAIGRRLGSVPVGLTAGLLLAVAPLTSRYGQEARPYALAALVATVAAWRLVIATSTSRDLPEPTDAPPDQRRQTPAPAWAWYAAAVVATGAVNVLALLVLAGHVVFVLAARRPHLRAWFTATGTATAILVPFLLATSRQSGQVGWLTRPDPDDLGNVLSAPFGGLLLPAMFLVAAAAVGHRPAVILGVAWGLLPPVLLWLVSQAHPMFDGRYTVAALPGTALAIAALASPEPLFTSGLPARLPSGLPARLTTRLRGGITALLVIVPVATLAVHGWPAQCGYRDPASGHAEDVRGLTRTITSEARPGDAVLFVPYHLRIVLLPGPYATSADPDATHTAADVALGRGPAESATLTGVDVPASELTARLAGQE